MKGNVSPSRGNQNLPFYGRIFTQCLQNKEYTSADISDGKSIFIKVRWIVLNEFTIKIPEDEGKLTNVRPATFYEEYLPFVQEQIINKIFTKFTV